MTRPPAGSTTLLFQAPPAPPVEDEVDDAPPPRTRTAQSTGPNTGPSTGAGLRMLKGARAAAAGMKISDDQIRAVLEDPQDVQPDPKQPTRTRMTRDGITVTTGNDGMILRVMRKR